MTNSNSKILLSESNTQDSENQNQQNFTHAIVFEIELINGKKSAITTIYQNKDISFEEIICNMSKAIEKSNNIKSMTPSVGSIKSGKYKRSFLYAKKEFNRHSTSI